MRAELVRLPASHQTPLPASSEMNRLVVVSVLTWYDGAVGQGQQGVALRGSRHRGGHLKGGGRRVCTGGWVKLDTIWDLGLEKQSGVGGGVVVVVVGGCRQDYGNDHDPHMHLCVRACVLVVAWRLTCHEVDCQ